jgi:hypothetical protein
MELIIRVNKEERSVGNQKGDHERHANIGNINPAKYITTEA